MGQSAAGQLAMAAAPGVIGQITGTAIGMATAGWNDRRQLRQQGKLNEQELQMQNRMAELNYARQLRMWEETGYGAQMEQMKKAGLNPALMYGMGGGGAQTVGASGPSASAPDAPKGGGEIQGMATLGMQLGLESRRQQAEIELLRAETNKTNVEAEKTAGVDTTKTRVEIQSLSQGISNQQAVEELTRIEAKIKRVDLGFNQGTYDDRMEYIAQQAREMTGKASQALIQANLDEASRQTRVDTIKAEYIKKLLENAYLTASTKAEYKSIELMDSERRLKDKQFDALVQDIMQKWNSLGNDNDRINMLKSQMNFDQDPSNVVLNGLAKGIGSVLTLKTGK